jgi:hypothetical protein
MSNPLSMFYDEDGSGDWSTTRVNAFIVILTVCAATIVLACKGVGIAWPLTALGVVAMFAVSIKALCSYVAQWFSSSPGQKLLGALMEKVTTMATGSSSSTVHTEEKHG